MATKISEMTAEELTALIESLIDRKLAEWLGDPDEGLELREEIRQRIIHQRQEHAIGRRGKPLTEIAARFKAE